MNMNFNLNDNSLLGNGIFNNGEAGRVTNVSLTMSRRAADAAGNTPDVKFHYTDGAGGTVDDGYYRFAPDASRTNEDNEKSARLKFGKLLSIANCIIPQGFQFPDTTNMSATQIEDVLLNVIESNISPDKKVNVFVNYGRKGNPQRYLRVRTFNFIEHASVEEANSRLKVNTKDDNMEQFNPDQAPAGNSQAGFGTLPPASGTTSNFWGGSN